jgi:hypothetical protein
MWQQCSSCGSVCGSGGLPFVLQAGGGWIPATCSRPVRRCGSAHLCRSGQENLGPCPQHLRASSSVLAVPRYSPQVRSVFVIAAPLPRCQTSVLGLMGRAQPSRFRFDLHPKWVFFHCGLPPFSLGLSSNPLGCEPAVPKPIRKLSRKGGARGKISAPNACASEAISCGEMATYVTSS